MGSPKIERNMLSDLGTRKNRARKLEPYNYHMTLIRISGGSGLHSPDSPTIFLIRMVWLTIQARRSLAQMVARRSEQDLRSDSSAGRGRG